MHIDLVSHLIRLYFVDEYLRFFITQKNNSKFVFDYDEGVLYN